MNNKEALQDWIAKKLPMSQARLAKISGVAQPNISRLVNGGNINFDNLAKILDSLGARIVFPGDKIDSKVEQPPLEHILIKMLIEERRHEGAKHLSREQNHLLGCLYDNVLRLTVNDFYELATAFGKTPERLLCYACEKLEREKRGEGGMKLTMTAGTSRVSR